MADFGEGIAGSYLPRLTGREVCQDWCRTYATTYLIDHERDGWYPELNTAYQRKVQPGTANRTSILAQACPLAILPVCSSAVGAIRRRGI